MTKQNIFDKILESKHAKYINDHTFPVFNVSKDLHQWALSVGWAVIDNTRIDFDVMDKDVYYRGIILQPINFQGLQIMLSVNGNNSIYSDGEWVIYVI